MQDEELISFKDMCARFDVTPRTLRYYEYIELLKPFKEGRARFYGPREVARMTLICAVGAMVFHWKKFVSGC